MKKKEQLSTNISRGQAAFETDNNGSRHDAV